MYVKHSDLNLTVKTPLGPDVLIIDKLKCIEGISMPFEIDLEMHSKQHDLAFDDLVGQDITVTFNYGSETRYFSGIVGEISQGFTVNVDDAGNNIELTKYYAKLYPKFWILKFSQDHQIFQEKSAMDIVNDLLGQYGVTKKKDQTSSCGQSSYEYCVQYRESYFDFISRLFEGEGIFYSFDHSASGEEMVIGDDSSTAESAYTELPMTPFSDRDPWYDEIQFLRYAKQVVSKKFQTADYNFETASTKLLSNAAGEGEGLEVYRFPGYYPDGGTGDGYSTNRIQELEWRKEMISGQSSAPLLSPMKSFTVKNHPRDDLNKSYIVYKVTHEINLLATGDERLYSNTFEAFPADVPFRSPIVTHKPTIASTQTAKVTGKSGEEIWCDEYGRIKVKFHWDQKGSDDEKSSCWIRVAQLWAGSGWGGLWTPRIGMEVVVTFLEGDPDRPLITGCVYNSDNMPPYAKDEPTKSTILSNTTKGGNGNNEFRFEDKKDEEEIYIHAQKDMNTVVEDNRTLKINDGDDTSDIMVGDRTVTLHGETAKKDKESGKGIGSDTLTLHKGCRLVELKAEGDKQGDHTLKLTKGDNTIEITKGNMITKLDEGDKKTTLTKGDMEITLTQGNMTTKLDQGDQTLTVTGKRDITVTQAETHTNSDAFSHTISGDYELTISGGLTIKVAGAVSISTDDDLELKAGGDMKLTADGDIKLSSSGDTKIASDGDTKIDATGDFKASGNEVKMTGQTKGTLDGGPDTQVTGNGKVQVGSSSTMTQVKGSMLQLN
ncbi:MAG: type VI secretion system tip protein VgrG [Candidatus Paracaedibacteraceae bacterium]|nr:type VI secretion system tip protein VgrG [Candidatus Paracaedibacteraceae bacterium]